MIIGKTKTTIPKQNIKRSKKKKKKKKKKGKKERNKGAVRFKQ